MLQLAVEWEEYIIPQMNAIPVEENEYYGTGSLQRSVSGLWHNAFIEWDGANYYATHGRFKWDYAEHHQFQTNRIMNSANDMSIRMAIGDNGCFTRNMEFFQ